MQPPFPRSFTSSLDKDFNRGDDDVHERHHPHDAQGDVHGLHRPPPSSCASAPHTYSTATNTATARMPNHNFLLTAPPSRRPGTRSTGTAPTPAAPATATPSCGSSLHPPPRVREPEREQRERDEQAQELRELHSDTTTTTIKHTIARAVSHSSRSTPHRSLSRVSNSHVRQPRDETPARECQRPTPEPTQECVQRLIRDQRPHVIARYATRATANVTHRIRMPPRTAPFVLHSSAITTPPATQCQMLTYFRFLSRQLDQQSSHA